MKTWIFGNIIDHSNFESIKITGNPSKPSVWLSRLLGRGIFPLHKNHPWETFLGYRNPQNGMTSTSMNVQIKNTRAKK